MSAHPGTPSYEFVVDSGEVSSTWPNPFEALEAREDLMKIYSRYSEDTSYISVRFSPGTGFVRVSCRYNGEFHSISTQSSYPLVVAREFLCDLHGEDPIVLTPISL